MLRTTLQNKSRGATIKDCSYISLYIVVAILRGSPFHLTTINNLKSRITNNGLHISFNGQEQSQIANNKQRPSHFYLTAINNLKSRITILLAKTLASKGLSLHFVISCRGNPSRKPFHQTSSWYGTFRFMAQTVTSSKQCA